MKKPIKKRIKVTGERKVVLARTAEQTAGRETVVLRVGSTYSFEPNEYLEFKVIGDEPVIVHDVFHPPREDYLPTD